MRDDHLSWYYRWRNLYGDRFANPFRKPEEEEEPETEEAAIAGESLVRMRPEQDKVVRSFARTAV